MTQEEKELLLKDICARLPYGLKYNYCGYDGCDYTMNRVDCNAVDCAFPIENVKPYLFPPLSMTDEEWEDYQKIRMIDWVHGDINGTFINASLIVDWLNAHHFDYRGLIDKSLALDATGLNIY